MVFDISKISNNLDYIKKTEKNNGNFRDVYLKGEKAFLIVNKNTIEVRTDSELRKLLVDKYESVMESRYFGKGGIEIVLAGAQLSLDEIKDLVRLSYDLT